MYVSTTKTGDYPVNIIVRSRIPIALAGDPQIKVLLKGAKGLAENEEVDDDIGKTNGFKVKWRRDVEDARDE